MTAMPVGDDGWALARWEAVVARLPDPHPFVLPEWQRAWWTHFGRGELAVLALGDAGVAALHGNGDGTLRFLGSRDVTDYPGPAVAPGRERDAAALLLQGLDGRAWSVLDVENARPDDPFAAHLEAAARGAGLRVEQAPDEPVAVLALPGSWAGYMRGLGRHARHELARKGRHLRSASVRTADAASLQADLDAFFALFRAARGDKGAFATPRVERFMREVAVAALARGTLRLDVLELGGTPLAITLGFQGPRTYYLYNMAYDRRPPGISPGIVLLAALIERAIGEGRERFDFMRGLERYKLELGAAPASLVRLRVARH
jgi:CelD/BcsL family acetyltransferase involved in cellulose biosynthesis